MRTYLLAKVSSVLDPSAATQQAYRDAFGVLVGSQKPACFSESGNHVLTAMEKGFEKLLVVLSECGCSSPDRLTVFQFYTWLDHLNEKYEAQKPKPNPQHGQR
ncbi:hypothetical protein [Spirosoma areae]